MVSSECDMVVSLLNVEIWQNLIYWVFVLEITKNYPDIICKIGTYI